MIKTSDYVLKNKINTHKRLNYQYFTDINHPLADKYGFVYYHRHIFSIKIGRWIKKSEIVHHKDGNRTNNSVKNLELLTQKEHGHKHHGELPIVNCIICKKSFKQLDRKNWFCSSKCLGIFQKKIPVSDKQLSKLVWEKPMIYLAKDMGVSDRAIEKYCDRHQISRPKRGYWQKRLDSTIGSAIAL